MAGSPAGTALREIRCAVGIAWPVKAPGRSCRLGNRTAWHGMGDGFAGTRIGKATVRWHQCVPPNPARRLTSEDRSYSKPAISSCARPKNPPLTRSCESEKELPMTPTTGVTYASRLVHARLAVRDSVHCGCQAHPCCFSIFDSFPTIREITAAKKLRRAPIFAAS